MKKTLLVVLVAAVVSMGVSALGNILLLNKIATGSIPAAAAGNEGGIVYDDTLNFPKYSDGTAWSTEFCQPASSSQGGCLTTSVQEIPPGTKKFGSLQVDKINGTPIQQILSEAITTDFADTAINTCATEVSITVAGANASGATGCFVATSNLGWIGGIYYCYVSGASTVKLGFCCVSGASCNPGNNGYRVWLMNL